MTLRGFTYRFAYVVLFTWIVGSINDSFWVALIWALIPLWFYEMLRPRRCP